MLIDKLLLRQQVKVKLLAGQGLYQQQVLQAEQYVLQQKSRAFLGTAPGLIISFGAGCLFQLRQHSPLGSAWSLLRLYRLGNVF